MGQALPKAPSQSTVAHQPGPKSRIGGMSDPINLLHNWISVEMRRAGVYPNWWKEIKTIEMCSARDPHRVYSLATELSKAEVLHQSQWQVAAFWLPLTQKEVLGWWDSPPYI